MSEQILTDDQNLLWNAWLTASRAFAKAPPIPIDASPELYVEVINARGALEEAVDTAYDACAAAGVHGFE